MTVVDAELGENSLSVILCRFCFSGVDFMSNVVISFLGAGRYRDNVYNFRGFEVKARYASTAFISYIRGKRHTRVDSLVICGTQSSTWNLLSEYFSEMSESMFGSESQYAKAAEYLGAEDVTKANEAMLSFQRSQNLGEKKQDICAHEEFNSLLKELQDSLNNALEPVSFKVTLLEHSEIMGEYSQQTELLNRIRELDFINGGTQVYLDITNGMRIMPFAVFANFQCLCQLRNLNIKEICYMPESMPKTEPLVRLDAIENIKSRLRYLREHDLQSYNSKCALIKGIMKTEAPKPGQMPSVDVCFLDGATDILDKASMIARFNVTADPKCFRNAVAADAENKTRQDLIYKLMDISYCLNIGRYVHAADLIKKDAASILEGIKNDQIRDVLKDAFAWAYKTEMNGSTKDAGAKNAEALKELSSNYLRACNYIQAMNSCYSALMNYEFRQDTSKDDSKADRSQWVVESQKIRDAVNEKYKSIKGSSCPSPYNRLIAYRSMLIHKNDISGDGIEWNYNNKYTLEKLVYGQNEGSVSLTRLPKAIRECIKEFGVSSGIKSQKSSNENILISFIGSGDYAKCDYTYVDPAGSEKHEFDITGSRVIGMSLAGKVNSFSGKNKLTKLLICGTRTSNWRMVLFALQQEFAGRLSAEVRDDLDTLVDSIKEHQDRDASDASVSEELVCRLNNFLSVHQKELGLEIKIVMSGDRISDPGYEQKLFEMIESNVGFKSRVSFDITHCYRIIPILVLCIIEHLVVVKKIKIEHIFYGEVPLEKDFNFLNGLKKSQLESDEEFSDKLKRIESVLSDNTEKQVMSGSVYDMMNISRLFDYSFALGQYRATDDPAFLEPLMAAEYKDSNPDVYDDFQKGVFLNNFLMLKDSCSFLLNVIIALNQPVRDPVLAVLKKELLESLTERVPVDDNYDYSSDPAIQLAFMRRRVRKTMEQNNYMEALCYCDEAMLLLPEYLYGKIREFGKNSCKIDENGKIRFSRGLPEDVYGFLRPLEDDDSCNVQRFAETIGKHGFKKDNKHIMPCNSALAAALYKDLWLAISRPRNNIFHADESRKLDFRKKVRESLENALSVLEHQFDQN